MQKSQSCPNLSLSFEEDGGPTSGQVRRYSGSYLNVLKLDPISEDANGEHFEA